MENIKEVLKKSTKIKERIDSILQFPTYNIHDDLSGLDRLTVRVREVM